MGDYEVFSVFTATFLLGTLIYNLLTSLALIDILKRFGFVKPNRRDFYECGFKPQTQKPIKVSLQFLIICIFFLLYDIELIFLFPFASSVTFIGLFDTLLLMFFFFVLYLSLQVDYNRHALF